MKHLCDTNVFLAIAVEAHPHHEAAAEWFAGLTEPATACFCRATQTSFLRLLTQKIASGYAPLTNAKAWETYESLRKDDAVGFAEEPPALDRLWHKFSASQSSSPKLWMDAYLAAFAIANSMWLVTLDRDFRHFLPAGLHLLHLPTTP